ncbi:SDR family NAD(P)-dependent oxidoreductase [Amycolatopsis sp. NPDC051102]|uniref:SDR family NAD(P)-dependent oxidoreductase n=1 Tax=Amycolatopsis sp. NPDC051102 TaxID=3155163 RepID=UPI00342B5AE1
MHSKTALVTGGSSAIGREVAMALASQGMTVAVCSRRAEGGQATVDALREAGGDAFLVRFDGRHADATRDAIQSVVDRCGSIDVAVNNAGGTLGRSGTVADFDVDSWDEILDANLRTTWLTLKYEMKHMVAQGHGAIVNNIGALGVRAVPGMCAYVAAKHAVVGLTKTAAVEGAAFGVRVNAVAPSMTERYEPDDEAAERARGAAEAIPLGRIARADEVAACVAWLCSDASSFVTGDVLMVDGGITISF